MTPVEVQISELSEDLLSMKDILDEISAIVDFQGGFLTLPDVLDLRSRLMKFHADAFNRAMKKPGSDRKAPSLKWPASSR